MRRIIALLLLCLPLGAVADERILSFHSDVHVMTDGMIEVTETITVRAEGKQIRRGIYRDFPVEYEDRLGNGYKIKLEPLSVLRDGQPEAFHTVRSGRDVRTYFGSSSRFIDHGEHTRPRCSPSPLLVADAELADLDEAGDERISRIARGRQMWAGER